MIFKNTSPALRLACATLLVAGWTVLAFAAEERLSPIDAHAAEPSLAVGRNGLCVAGWVQSPSPGAPSEIVLRRQRLDGGWEILETIQAARPDTSLERPVLAIDFGGFVHTAWVASGPDYSAVEYVVETPTGWLRYAPLVAPPPMKAEALSLGVLPPDGKTHLNDAIFLAWQERMGSYYRIRSFVLEADGQTYSDILAGENRLLSIMYPETLLTPGDNPDENPDLAVSWYDLEHKQARLELRVWDRKDRQWREKTRALKDDSLLDSIPLVVASPRSGLFLLGNEEVERFDQIVLSSPRLGLLRLNDQPRTHNRFPHAGPASGDIIPVVWQRESASGVQLFQAAFFAEGSVAAYPLAEVDRYVPADPDIVYGNGFLQAVWVAPPDRQEGDASTPTPGIWHRSTRVAPADWTKISH